MDKSIHSKQNAILIKILSRMRTEAGITQTQLADKLAMTQSAYSKLERGELRIDLVQLRAILLEIGGSLGEFVAHFETELSQSMTNSKRKQK